MGKSNTFYVLYNTKIEFLSIMVKNSKIMRINDIILYQLKKTRNLIKSQICRIQNFQYVQNIICF